MLKLAPLALVLTASLSARAADCPGCNPGLCREHVVKEDDLIKELRTFKAKKLPFDRRPGLDKVIKVCSEHLNFRTKKMAEALKTWLEDDDVGIRETTIEVLATTQDPDTATELIGKLLDKLLPKLTHSRPKDTKKAGEFDNQVKMVKLLLTSLQKMNSPDAVTYLVVALDTENLPVLADVITTSSSFRDSVLIDKYLEVMDRLCPMTESDKDQPKREVFVMVSGAFVVMSGYTVPMDAADRDKWLRMARTWWKEAMLEWK